MNNEYEIDCQYQVDNDSTADSGDSPRSRMPKELKALITDTVDRLKDEAYRNGFKATKHKKQQRADYAAEILATEGRAVRKYQRYNTEEARKAARKEQKSASKARRSPAQVEREKEADTKRKRSKVVGKRKNAQKALEAAPDYAKF